MQWSGVGLWSLMPNHLYRDCQFISLITKKPKFLKTDNFSRRWDSDIFVSWDSYHLSLRQTTSAGNGTYVFCEFRLI